MKAFALRILDFLIYSNIFISIAAVCFASQTMLQFGFPLDLHPFYFLIFFATLVEYNLHRFVALNQRSNLIYGQKYSWLRKNIKFFYFMFFSSVLGLVISMVFLDRLVLLALVPLAIITTAYSIPLFKTQKGWTRLRELPLMKIFFIAMVWSFVTVWLPTSREHITLLNQDIMLLSIERFFFVFAITVPFDIRDKRSDLRSGVITLPILAGTKKAVMFAQLALAVFLVMGLIHYHQKPFIQISYVLSAVTTSYVLQKQEWSSHKYYHYGLLDGTMILQFLFILFFQWLL